MKTFPLLALICLAFASPSFGQETKAKTKTKTPAAPAPAMVPVKDDPALPRVLLIGDSISIGYTLPVREELKGKANVHRIPANGGPTVNGLKKMKDWLGTGKWDVIHFNFGIHDSKFLEPSKQQVAPADYEKNLREIVALLKTTKAKLIWASSTPIPSGELVPPRTFDDINKYNAIAKKVMEETGVAIDDLNTSVTPRLAEYQKPKDVHFHPEGSAFLGKKVAESIREQLKK